MLEEFEIFGPEAGATRKIWLQPGTDPDAQVCLLFLDAELYIERVGAPSVIDELWRKELIPPAHCAYLSYGTTADRHVDFACSDRFTEYLMCQVLPRIQCQFPTTKEFILIGLSLSGLAAAYAAFKYSGIFKRIVCQSPSAWWNDEWLEKQISQANLTGTRCWLSVGDLEVEENVTHGPSGMVQRTSQVNSCTRLAASLQAVGMSVQFQTFEGGHDPACWSNDLPRGLKSYLAN